MSKAIDKAAGVEREVVGPGQYASRGRRTDNRVYGEATPSEAEVVTLPATPDAEQWQGWGTALKPALETITMARKPLIGTVAANVLAHGTGGLNIDGCRVGDEVLPAQTAGQAKIGTFERGEMVTPERVGRWPANLIHDGSDEVLAGFPVTAPSRAARRGSVQRYDPADEGAKRPKGGNDVRGVDDNGGSAARFFYCAKASKADRN